MGGQGCFVIFSLRYRSHTTLIITVKKPAKMAPIGPKISTDISVTRIVIKGGRPTFLPIIIGSKTNLITLKAKYKIAR